MRYEKIQHIWRQYWFAIVVGLISLAGCIAYWWGYSIYDDDMMFSYIFSESPFAEADKAQQSQLITSWEMVVDRMAHCYIDDNGRLAQGLIIVMLYALPAWLRNIFCGIVMGIVPFVIAWAGGGLAALRRKWIIAAIIILFWMWMPWYDRIDVFAFFMNYIFAGLLFALTVGLTRQGSSLWLLCLMAFISSWMHEEYAVGLVAFFAAMALFSRKKSLIWPTLCALSGFAICMFSPGRMESSDRMSFEIGRIVSFFATSDTIAFLLPTAIMIGACVLAFCLSRHKCEISWVFLGSIVVAVCALICVVAVMQWNGRIFIPVLLSTLIGGTCLLGHLNRFEIPKWATLLGSLTFIAIYSIFCWQMALYHQRGYEERRELINKMWTTFPNRVFFSDKSSLYVEKPWWLFNTTPNSMLFLHRFYNCNPLSFYSTEKITLLPTKYARMPFNQWPKIEGDNPLYGNQLNFIDDSLYVNQWAQIEFGDDLPSQPPHLALLRRLKYGPLPHTLTVHLSPWPLTLWPPGSPDACMLYFYELDGVGIAMRNAKINRIDFVEGDFNRE